MTVAEIVILIVGALLFTISFFIPDKSGDRTEDIESLLSSDAARDAITGALDGEISRAKDDLRDALEEQLTDNKDRLDRYMDRITNEKMMAVSEYSDTVLQQIHKDHEEAVFHDRPERDLVRASVSPEEQLEGEEPLHLRQLQPDQHG